MPQQPDYTEVHLKDGTILRLKGVNLSDDEIRAGINRYRAQQQGGNANANAKAPEPPGFFHRLAESAGLPTSWDEFKAAAEGDQPHSFGEAIKKGTIKGIDPFNLHTVIPDYVGRVYQRGKEAVSEAKEAGENIAEGGPVLQNVGKALSGVYRTGIEATPIIGHAMNTASDDIASGNYSGAAGGLTGVVGQIALPEMIERAPVVGRVVGDAAKNQSYRMYNNVLGTKGRNMAFGANPGRGVAAEGIWGGHDALQEGIGNAIKTRGGEADQVLNLPQNAAKRLDVTNAVNEPFERAINNGIQGSTADATIGRLQQAHKEVVVGRRLTPTGQIEYTGRKNFTNLTPAEANELKTDLYDRTNYNNPDLDESVNNTLRQSAHGVKDAVEDAVPDVVPFNQRLNDLFGAKKALTKRINNRMSLSSRYLLFPRCLKYYRFRP